MALELENVLAWEVTLLLSCLLRLMTIAQLGQSNGGGGGGVQTHRFTPK